LRGDPAAWFESWVLREDPAARFESWVLREDPAAWFESWVLREGPVAGRLFCGMAPFGPLYSRKRASRPQAPVIIGGGLMK